MIDIIIGHYNYWVVILLMMAGFYTVINRGNLIKKIAGLNIFQTSVFLLFWRSPMSLNPVEQKSIFFVTGNTNADGQQQTSHHST